MKTMALLALLLVVIDPSGLPAFQDHRPVGRVLDTIPPRPPPPPDENAGATLPGKLPVDPGSDRKPARPNHPGHRPHRPDYGRPTYWWPAVPTIVQASQPIIIVNNPPPAEPPPPPEPEKVWVPPVMEMRTEPGYWDYGVRKRWMGDHWRYEQDFDQPTWVPERQVQAVKQEGYWKTAD